jgi:hypothetical protein
VIASRARIQLAEMLMWQRGITAAGKEYQAVIDDPYAAERDKLRATVMLAHVLMETDRYDEAAPLLKRLGSTDPAGEDQEARSLLARASLDLGKLQRRNGDDAAAAGSFERALELAPEWAQDVRREAEALARLGEAEFAVSIRAEDHMVYEAQGAEIRPGLQCTAYHVASVQMAALSATGEPLSGAILFSSPKTVSAAERGGQGTTEYEDESGFHVRFEGKVEPGGPGQEMPPVTVIGEKQLVPSPLTDVSLIVTSVSNDDGTVTVSVKARAPEGARLSVAGSESARFVLDAIAPQPREAARWGIEFQPMRGKDETTYEFRIEPIGGGQGFVPRITLTLPGKEKPVAKEQMPAGPVKEIRGTLGEITYELTSEQPCVVHEWIVRSDTLIVIPESTR